jgi:nucleotide-binding universal stress UspA family protein
MASRFFHPRSGSASGHELLGVLGPRRIVVPVRGQPVDQDALRAACRLARPAKAAVLVITVLEVPRNLPLSVSLDQELGRAEEVLELLEQLATHLGTKIETTVLQAREMGPAVVDEAQRWGADLMVVGLGAPPLFGEFSLDRTGEVLLSQVQCRLILIREALDARKDRRAWSLPSSPD